jgi:peroxiredoxin-like protein
MAELHEYPVTVAWTGGRNGTGHVTAERTDTTNALSVPPEFQGPGEGTNPEELLTSAIAACYSITYGIIAGVQRLPFEGIETSATGAVEQNGANFTYKTITLRPTIRLTAGADEATVRKAEELSHKADLYCIITNAVRGKVEIVLEPTIQVG